MSSLVRSMLGAAALGAIAFSWSCSASSDSTLFGAGGAGGDDNPTSGHGGSSSPAASTGEGGDIGVGGSGVGGADPGCSDATKLIYIIGQDNAFFSFDPPTLEVKPLGFLNCPQSDGFGTPFSMAVDRDGIAWVLFSDGKIYHVDVNTVACTPTAFVPGQQGFYTFGMGFVSDTNGSDAETLYVADIGGTGIAKVDTTTLALSFIGGYDALSGSAELTGTGDARLFGFFLSEPVIVAELDKTNAKVLSQAPQPSVSIGSGWAFAFWGGDFYLFTNPSGIGSQIDRYRPSDGTTMIVKTNLGSNIVGAGVSTCAPVTPPN